MTLEEVFAYPQHANVLVFCTTTTKPIHYRGPDLDGRHPSVASPITAIAIPYIVSGRIVGMETGTLSGSDIDYLVLTYQGQAPVVGSFLNGLRRLPTLETRTRIMHVPISAIKRITIQPPL